MELQKATKEDVLSELRKAGITSLDQVVDSGLRQAKAGGSGDPSQDLVILYGSGRYILILPD